MSLAPDRQAELVQVIQDPVLFGRGVLQHRYWSMQTTIMQAVSRYSQVAVKACHASSKTFTAADIVLWWLACYQDAKVVTTAPTWLQVEALLWGEIRSSIRNSRIAFPQPNQTSLKIADNRYAIGLSTDQPTRFQGFHGGHVLVVFDEATGIRAPIWEALEGIRAGGSVHVLAIGNPTELGNPFHTIYQSQLTGWKRFTISAFDTPNLAGESVETLQERLSGDRDLLDSWWSEDPWPMLITRRWVGEALRNWGTEHPLWQSRVLGEFPDNDTGAVIPLSWVTEANRRWIDRYGAGVVPEPDRVSMDIGSGEEGSDKTVFAKRRNMDIVGLEKSNTLKPMEGVNKLHAILANSRVTAIIDWLGIGIGPSDRLRELNVRHERFIASGSTDMRDKTGMYGFVNVRSAAWWNTRELLNPENGTDIALPPDEELTGELTAPTWKEVAGAKIAVESKQDIRKRIGRSTDVADAVIMAYWGRPGGGGGQRKDSVWEQAGVSAHRNGKNGHRGKSVWAT